MTRAEVALAEDDVEWAFLLYADVSHDEGKHGDGKAATKAAEHAAQLVQEHGQGFDEIAQKMDFYSHALRRVDRQLIYGAPLPKMGRKLKREYKLVLHGAPTGYSKTTQDGHRRRIVYVADFINAPWGHDSRDVGNVIRRIAYGDDPDAVRTEGDSLVRQWLASGDAQLATAPPHLCKANWYTAACLVQSCPHYSYMLSQSLQMTTFTDAARTDS